MARKKAGTPAAALDITAGPPGADVFVVDDRWYWRHFDSAASRDVDPGGPFDTADEAMADCSKRYPNEERRVVSPGA